MVTLNFVCVRKEICNKFSKIPLVCQGENSWDSEKACVRAGVFWGQWGAVSLGKGHSGEDGEDLWSALSAAGPKTHPPVGLEPLKIFLSNHDT